MTALQSRIATETLIAMQCVTTALDMGHSVSVNDGEEFTVEKSRDKKAIKAALQTTDEDYLHFYRADGTRIGWVFLVYGNEGWDVMSDSGWPASTDGSELAAILLPAEQLAEKKEALWSKGI